MRRISVDNGRTFVSVEQAIKEVGFDEITSWMDKEIMEQVHSMYFEGNVEFVEKYLKVSDHDLIIG